MTGPKPSRGGERREIIHIKEENKETQRGKCVTRIFRRKKEEHVRLSS
jgi:hypothetical protein